LERSADGWGEQEVEEVRDEKATIGYRQNNTTYNHTK
jgi:hypothetical protein